MLNSAKTVKMSRDVMCTTRESLCRGRLPSAVINIDGKCEGENFDGELKAYCTPLGTYVIIKMRGLPIGAYRVKAHGDVLAQLYSKDGGEAWCNIMTSKISAASLTKEAIIIDKIKKLA